MANCMALRESSAASYSDASRTAAVFSARFPLINFFWLGVPSADSIAQRARHSVIVRFRFIACPPYRLSRLPVFLLNSHRPVLLYPLFYYSQVWNCLLPAPFVQKQ